MVMEELREWACTVYAQAHVGKTDNAMDGERVRQMAQEE